ncbi:MAG: nicotinamide-nucleotide adenylyltransferase [Candidatus Bathyarchaeia archaeon]
MKRGLFVGRFQPFHNGHLKVVKDLLQRVDELIIAVGSSQYSHEASNPFTAGERMIMIRKALEVEKISPSKFWITPIPDLNVHMLWVAQVVGYTPKFDVVFTNEPLTRRLFIEAGYRVESIPYYKRDIYSATEIRRRILKGEPWEDLVPKPVMETIIEIGGVERIRQLAESDKPTRS